MDKVILFQFFISKMSYNDIIMRQYQVYSLYDKYNPNNLELWSKHINKLWNKFINRFSLYTTNHQHIFLQDLDLAMKWYPWEKVDIKDILLKPSQIENIFEIDGCNYIPTEILPKEFVDKLFKYLSEYQTVPKWSYVEKKLSQMSNYLFYSNVNLDEYQKILQNKEKDRINILILGAGPTGLYVANYLKTINLISPRINLLIVDNRIVKSNASYRLPYTRNRIFGVNLDLFVTFFEKFACMKELLKQGGVKIKYLENLLIILAYGNEIPMYFTDNIIDELSLKKFIVENKIDVVFDCTGGRFKNNFITNLTNPQDFFEKNIIFENEWYKINITNNEARLQWKDNIQQRYYLSAEIYDDNGKFMVTAIWTEPLLYLSDVELFLEFNNKCIKIKKGKLDAAKKFFDENISGKNLKDKIKMMLRYYKHHHIKFYIIDTQIYHKLLISDIIDQPEYKTIYISAGDTIFSSHFAIGAGLNRLLSFMNNVIWSAQILTL